MQVKCFNNKKISFTMSKEMIAVMSRCVKTKKLFGIRFDTNNGKNWEAAWAFPLKEGADKREKGYAVSIKGSFVLGNDYPGCPYCGNPSFLCAESVGNSLAMTEKQSMLFVRIAATRAI